MLIKPSDLRIGNIVNGGLHLGHRDVVVKEIKIGFQGEYILSFVGEKDHNYIEKCVPIEITHEWLVRLGFEKKGPRDYVKHGDIKVHYPSDVFRIVKQTRIATGEEPSDYWSVEWSSSAVVGVMYGSNHIHVLQNLYYSLTGTELIVSQDDILS